jgi:hypothetical protein
MVSERLKAVNFISGEKLDMFYNVSIDKYCVALQGCLCEETLAVCKELNISLEWDNNFYALRGVKEDSGIRVTLTI